VESPKETQTNHSNSPQLTSNIRIQLTLFADPADAINIEQIRQVYNPLQFELIKAHVTLCREDEIVNLEQIIANLQLLTPTQHNLFLEFGKVARFDNGNGLFLPASNNTKEFEDLRKRILLGLCDNPRKQEPHITLMHPRNSICTDEIFEKIEKIDLPGKLEFRKVSLIKQVNGGKWLTLKEFEFKG